jgi:hypothetical protein
MGPLQQIGGGQVATAKTAPAVKFITRSQTVVSSAILGVNRFITKNSNIRIKE